MELKDQFGRVADDLRISLIDKCNLRCTYCMPAEGMDWLNKTQVLTAEEAIRIADIGVRLFGIRDIRFTGGEPLVRRDLEDIIAGVRALHPDVSIAITTNAIGLERRAAALREAGLTRINVSLDTICPETFAKLARRDRLADVLRGVQAALDAGLSPVKINAVLMRGINEDGAADLLEWCLERGLQLRFIEQMPLDADRQWSPDILVDASEIRSRLSERFVLSEAEEPRGSAPAQLWNVRRRGGGADAPAGGAEAREAELAGRPVVEEEPAGVRAGDVLGQVGVIASVTEPFCGACSRTRITADGKVRTCLFSHAETDLLQLLRGGASDDEIADRWAAAMWLKPMSHGTTNGVPEAGDAADVADATDAAAEIPKSSGPVPLNSPVFRRPKRSMSAIGG